MRMSSLAEVTNASLSRLSHLVKRLEQRGLVRHEPDPTDGRFTNAILTDSGFQALAEAAPGHVAHVRSLIIDVLSPEQLRRLGRDATASCRASTPRESQPRRPIPIERSDGLILSVPLKKRRCSLLLSVSRDVPESRTSAICGLAQLASVVPGGPSSTVGTYSNSCSPPSKVRLSTRSSLTSGYPS